MEPFVARMVVVRRRRGNGIWGGMVDEKAAHYAEIGRSLPWHFVARPTCGLRRRRHGQQLASGRLVIGGWTDDDHRDIRIYFPLDRSDVDGAMKTTKFANLH
jgi:hypothetical protein